MKQNIPADTGSKNGKTLRRTILLLLAGAASLISQSQAGVPAGRPHRNALQEGDILYVDSGNGLDGGGLFKLNRRTGERTALAIGGQLRMPYAVTVDPRSGMAVVSDSGRLIAVDPADGTQVVVADHDAGNLGTPYGLDFDARGNLVVANTQAIVRMDARTAQLEVLSLGGSLRMPLTVAVGRGGDLLVVNWSGTAEILRVNPRTGEQSVITRGGLLSRPQGIALAGETIYVTDVGTSDGNFGIGRVIRIDAATGHQEVVSEGGFLVGPVGIAMGTDGQLVVGDPYTVNPESPDWYDGGIIQIDPANGEQTLLVRGMQGFVNPRGVAVVARVARD